MKSGICSNITGNAVPSWEVAKRITAFANGTDMKDISRKTSVHGEANLSALFGNNGKAQTAEVGTV